MSGLGSLTFTAASFGAVLAVSAGAAAVIVALYLARRKRRRVEVPFSPMWRKVLGDRDRSSWWRRPRDVVSLLVQLLVLALIAVAAGDPRAARERQHRSVLLLVDTSGSMQALDERDDGGRTISRLERARLEAGRVARALGPTDEAMVALLDGAPCPLGPFTGDARALDEAIARLAPSDGVADLDRGLRLAADLLGTREQPQLVLISDGALADEALGRVRAGDGALGAGEIDLRRVDLRYVPVGTSGDNAAISAFAARRHPAHPGEYEVLVEARALGTRPIDCELQLFQGGELVMAEPLSLAAGARVQRRFANLSGVGDELEARLVARPGGAALDAFALDDRAFAELAPARALRVLLVTEGNLFLEGALLVDERAVVDRIAPAEWDAARAARYDAVVLDRFVPDAPPTVPAVYIDPRGARSPFAARGELKAPVVTEVARHPVMRFVSLTDVNVAAATRLVLAPGDVALASVGGDPIIVARQRPTPSLAIGFDLRRSDLPLRVAFPVMMVNAFDWFAGPSGEGGPALRVGEAARVVVGGEGEAALTAPGGARRTLRVVDGTARFAVDRAGWWRLGGAVGATMRLAANLDPEESRIAPVRSISVAGRALPLPHTSPRRAGREPWRVLLLVAVALLLVEWWAWHRRVLA